MTAVGLGSIQASPLTAPAHSVVTTILNPLTTGFGSLAGLALSKVAAWVLGGTKAALIETARAIGATTAPALTSAWFSSTYWRVAGLAALVTVPFVCAAALQAVMRSDLSLLTQAVLVYLPLALLGVSLAAPVTMLLLAATDGMCDGRLRPGCRRRRALPRRGRRVCGRAVGDPGLALLRGRGRTGHGGGGSGVDDRTACPRSRRVRRGADAAARVRWTRVAGSTHLGDPDDRAPRRL